LTSPAAATCLRGALRTLIAERMVTVEDEDVHPLLH
jgi:hypothetical protein